MVKAYLLQSSFLVTRGYPELEIPGLGWYTLQCEEDSTSGRLVPWRVENVISNKKEDLVNVDYHETSVYLDDVDR
ncbi:hypothetical protein NLI96_g7591 [Meripilus lineatus]|uniref:Uncharacterized protein n=1 Tax=Meripilus lineatus TaxID=2056292 RepID=A0AAD5UYX4_9APHY|nr:hypothetical protein NLI96_g7591 [Physisporinus lineatus]